MINSKFAFVFLIGIVLLNGCIQQPPVKGTVVEQPIEKELTKPIDEPVVVDVVQEPILVEKNGYNQVETDVAKLEEIYLVEIPEETGMDIVSMYGSEELNEQVW